jgi:hypothetical protein
MVVADLLHDVPSLRQQFLLGLVVTGGDTNCA